jgi:hypothetical protein
MSSIESQGVVYGAAFDIPYAIGSVAIPLTGAAAPFPSSSFPLPSGSRHNPVGVDDEINSCTHAPTAVTAAREAEGKMSGSSSPARRRGVSSGSISSVRRCTHHRYCYIRDGGSLAQDAFYRWLQHAQQQQGETTDVPASRHDRHASTTSSSAPSSSSSSFSGGAMSQSPSPFYASLACVVFLLPNSFPHPRRVLRRPPFLIEDDTWAEHMVEVQLHFLPHLRIPPVTVVHQALLERRTLPRLPVLTVASSTAPAASEKSSAPVKKVQGEQQYRQAEVREVWVPQLRASTFGKPKLPPVATNVIVHQPVSSQTRECEDSISAADMPAVSLQHQALHHHYSHNRTVASATVVVAEKVDTLRLYHPTVPVLLHFRRLLGLSSLPVVRELQETFEMQVYQPCATTSEADFTTTTINDVADDSLRRPFRFAWSLPYEEVVAEYAAQRASTSVAVLQAVFDGLKRERAAMEETCRRSIEQIAELATKTIPDQLEAVHRRCLKLYRKE